jgi:DNA polymerase epsilon subunit 1
MTLQPVRFWCPLLILDTYDFAGLNLTYDEAQGVLAQHHRDPPLQMLHYDHTFSIWGRLPGEIRQRFVDRVMSVMSLIWRAKTLVLDSLWNELQVTLATKSERIQEKMGQLLSQLLERDFQAELIEEVQQMIDQRVAIVDSDESVSVKSSVSGALEYTKVLMKFLEVLPLVSTGVRKTKNNCLRICGVGPFAPIATFEASEVTAVMMLNTRCSFCNEEVFLDLTRSSGARCHACSSGFPTDAIEAELVRRVHRLVIQHAQQDFVCTGCKRVVDTLLSSGCCGQMIGKMKNAGKELQAILVLAKSQKFQWLVETTEAALGCI